MNILISAIVLLLFVAQCTILFASVTAILTTKAYGREFSKSLGLPDIGFLAKLALCATSSAYEVVTVGIGNLAIFISKIICLLIWFLGLGLSFFTLGSLLEWWINMFELYTVLFIFVILLLSTFLFWVQQQSYFQLINNSIDTIEENWMKFSEKNNTESSKTSQKDLTNKE